VGYGGHTQYETCLQRAHQKSLISGSVFSQAWQYRVLFALDVAGVTAAIWNILLQEMRGVSTRLPQRVPGYEIVHRARWLVVKRGKKRSKFGVNKLSNFATRPQGADNSIAKEPRWAYAIPSSPKMQCGRWMNLFLFPSQPHTWAIYDRQINQWIDQWA
jgi:hypothetical protein